MDARVQFAPLPLVFVGEPVGELVGESVTDSVADGLGSLELSALQPATKAVAPTTAAEAMSTRAYLDMLSTLKRLDPFLQTFECCFHHLLFGLTLEHAGQRDRDIHHEVVQNTRPTVL